MDLAEQGVALRRDGYCVVPGVLDPAMLGRVRAQAGEALKTITPEHRAAHRSQGSLVQVADFPGFAELIAWPPTLAALAGLGLTDVRYSSGYVISKPPRSPALFWHQDWWGWEDDVSYTDTICQVFLFYYLRDTTPENGCLRVLPGSHRRRHALHDLLDAHDERLGRVDDPNDVAYGGAAGEVAVPVNAGDVVIGDARVLHGSYANASDVERTLITLWYHHAFSAQSAGLQNRVYQAFCREAIDTDAPDGDAERLTLDRWPEPARAQVAPLFPIPTVEAPPEPWVRTPARLR